MPKNVFISWSGESSHKVALLLRKWLPRFVQSIEPFLSSEDIRKGGHWFHELTGELEKINFGIVCITPENMNAPWILFEAGALSKSLGYSRVAPLLINVSNSDLQGPLAQFNTTSLTQEDIKRLIESINLHLGERGIPSDLLDDAFEIGWPVFEEQLGAAVAEIGTPVAPSVRPQADILDELLQLTRNISQQISADRPEGIDLGRVLRVSSPEEAAKLINQLGELQNREREIRLLNVISHELLSAIVGIRSNAVFLQKRVHQLPDAMVKIKFDDILTDCEVLLLQVDELRYISGQEPFKSKIEPVSLFRDVILKTINQLKPVMRERGLNPSNIEYQREDMHKIKIFAHRAKLQQAVYNLLTNAIKYAEPDPEVFKIRITFVETKDHFIVKFQDWGIGIEPGLEDKIFLTGFRTPRAAKMSATGSGLGLTLARKVMTETGGDLILGNGYKPTEFRMLLPKSLKEAPDDTVRR